MGLYERKFDARLKGLGRLEVLTRQPYIDRTNKPLAVPALHDLERVFTAPRVGSRNRQTSANSGDIYPRLDHSGNH